MNNIDMLDMAREAMKKAYSPYSGFKVGAAVAAEDGHIYTGCNVENASYGAAVCGERTAAVKAVSEGHKRFTKIAITGSSGCFTYPCGICRQFLSEFMTEDAVVILEDCNEGIKEIKFSELMPYAFTSECIK